MLSKQKILHAGVSISVGSNTYPFFFKRVLKNNTAPLLCSAFQIERIWLLRPLTQLVLVLAVVIVTRLSRAPSPVSVFPVRPKHAKDRYVSQKPFPSTINPKRSTHPSMYNRPTSRVDCISKIFLITLIAWALRGTQLCQINFSRNWILAKP